MYLRGTKYGSSRLILESRSSKTELCVSRFCMWFYTTSLYRNRPQHAGGWIRAYSFDHTWVGRGATSGHPIFTIAVLTLPGGHAWLQPGELVMDQTTRVVAGTATTSLAQICGKGSSFNPPHFYTAGTKAPWEMPNGGDSSDRDHRGWVQASTPLSGTY